ncbi:hypothetical protein PSN45_002431 [Yamadazyma tenuis]|uniref:D123-domain-containing protein n=1 Tax=Candida tenuis (strain ATCC 10573 / BCRC 21748 / CBS 615 / JCM 9827 / NBRC 10315 / NRRL Y-1498 / VKM Y-70) TaxID=590646 RepID=G3B0H4_CANTC|nr:D123-domain-containing protein [Yamadazyma tenuis ATCC 10573]EGV65403.1 D123-domain-containing protein [Yamadazyma tenuis ATCC 10573]WEJ94929.1 hypothetical protein PSN45_002431 [Yamadazyma tenuis]
MTRDYTVFEEVKATKKDILNCRFSSWYPKLQEHSFEAEILGPLPSQFVEYLGAESIRLPLEDKVELDVTSDNEYSDWEDEEDSAEESDPIQGFVDLHEQVNEVVKKYRAVAPKLNWSAPKDSCWIMLNKTMKCQSASDVYLMLNASDHITHDLDFPFEDTHDEESDPEFDYELVLRKWRDINPALEFRVFVRNGEVVGKSQRDLNYYDYLEKLIGDNKLDDTINSFVKKTVVPVIENRSFIVDVYVPKPFSKVYVVDINPFTRITDSILYTWSELLNDKEDKTRLITETNIGRFKTKAYSENQVPLDVIQASSDPNSLAQLAREWQINEKK